MQVDDIKHDNEQANPTDNSGDCDSKYDAIFILPKFFFP